MNEQFSNDELQALWAAQPVDLTIPNLKELTMSLQNDYRKEQRRLLRLNLQELIPAIGISLWCGWQGLQATSGAWAFFGASLICLTVGLFLLGTSLKQRHREQAVDTNTLRGELERTRSQMQHRAWLYRNVAWWYLLPCAGAIVLLLIGGGANFAAPFTLGYLAIVAGAAALLYRVNRNIGRTKYAPKVEHVNRLIADLG